LLWKSFNFSFNPSPELFLQFLAKDFLYSSKNRAYAHLNALFIHFDESLQ